MLQFASGIDFLIRDELLYAVFRNVQFGCILVSHDLNEQKQQLVYQDVRAVHLNLFFRLYQYKLWDRRSWLFACVHSGGLRSRLPGRIYLFIQIIRTDILCRRKVLTKGGVSLVSSMGCQTSTTLENSIIEKHPLCWSLKSACLKMLCANQWEPHRCRMNYRGFPHSTRRARGEG